MIGQQDFRLAGLTFLAMQPPVAGAEAASVAWELGCAARGIYISEQRGANLVERI
jgi:hypothetical protein